VFKAVLNTHYSIRENHQFIITERDLWASLALGAESEKIDPIGLAETKLK
jgi:hypothetical protein